MRVPLTVTPCSSICSTRLLSKTSTPSCSSARFAFTDSASGKRGQDARRGLHQDHARAGGIEVAELLLHAVSRKLGDRAGQLHAGRTAAHDQERQQAAPLVFVFGRLGSLESGQHAPAHLGRILDRA